MFRKTIYPPAVPIAANERGIYQENWFGGIELDVNMDYKHACDYASLIAPTRFSRALPKTEYRSEVRIVANERGIWQRHFWEHGIRDETDFQRHNDYVHVNPLKHKLVNQVKDWPYSSFHRYVEGGIYPVNWCGDVDLEVHGDQ